MVKPVAHLFHHALCEGSTLVCAHLFVVVVHDAGLHVVRVVAVLFNHLDRSIRNISDPDSLVTNHEYLCIVVTLPESLAMSLAVAAAVAPSPAPTTPSGATTTTAASAMVVVVGELSRQQHLW